jgi:citrate synthase
MAARTVWVMVDERTQHYVPGLAGVPAARSSVCFVDGERGLLQYRGYPVATLAERCSYEEVAFLLLFGDLPTEPELGSFKEDLASERRLKFRIVDMLKLFPESGHPMDALASTIAAMGMFYPGDHVNDVEYRRRCAVRLVAKVPTIVAAFHRIRRGDDPIAPRADLGHAENFLYMLTGQTADPKVASALDTMLVLHAEHSMAPSTFCARVAASTLADPFAVVSTAVTALSGSLHGGANEDVLRMLRSIPATGPHAIREWAEDRLARREKISGFGHREYKVKDPRATIEQGLIDELFERFGRSTIYDTAVELEAQMRELVGDRGLYPNIDYYSGIVYEMLGLPTDLFTPMYAVARVAGWLAHLFEQVENNRMFRPSQIWEGEVDRAYVARPDRRG